MSNKIHKTAFISPNAVLGNNIEIGPYTIIADNVNIGDNTQIASHVVINGPTTLGVNNKIYQFSSIGEDPQDLKYKGENVFLTIGDNNVIREGCTINRGTKLGGGVTSIGNDNLFMAYVHIAHDCHIKNNVIIAVNVALAGHVIVEDFANLGGFVGVHQFCNIGCYSFAAASSIITKDVLPYTKVSGYYAKVFGLNGICLQRKNFSKQEINLLKIAYKIVYRQNLSIDEAL